MDKGRGVITLVGLMEKKFLGKPDTPEVRESMGEYMKEILSGGLRAVPRRKLNLDFSLNSDGSMKITPKDIYTLMYMTGLDHPDETIPEEEYYHDGRSAVYSMFDVNGKLNPVAYLKQSMAHITVKLGFNGE